MVNLIKSFRTFERYLIRFIVITLMALVVVQALMTQDSFRLYLSWAERMEGQEISYPVNRSTGDENTVNRIKSPKARVVIAIESFSSLPLTGILVNGQVSKPFSNKEVILMVKGGDKLEIDSSAYNFPVKYRIKEVSDNVAFPEAGNVYTANQGIVMIGNVIVK